MWNKITPEILQKLVDQNEAVQFYLPGHGDVVMTDFLVCDAQTASVIYERESDGFWASNVGAIVQEYLEQRYNAHFAKN